MSIITLDGVGFAYKKGEDVLSDVNLSIPESSIYGFLGANGAGKTTTLRLILGLLNLNKGSINIFDDNIKSTYPKHLQRIGSLIESPSLYGHLSGNANLRIWAKYHKVNTSKIDEVLELVDLTHAKKKATSKYSTGMKQRLGLAMALLHDPDLLILDEPTNGLDPMGIIALRKVIFNLRDQGKTILLSSHILSEVEKMVSHLGIIHEGKIIFEGKLEELQEKKKSNLNVRIRVSDPQSAMKVLAEELQAELQENWIALQVQHERDLGALVKTLVNNGIDLYELSHESRTLEDMFLRITDN